MAYIPIYIRSPKQQQAEKLAGMSGNPIDFQDLCKTSIETFVTLLK